MWGGSNLTPPQDQGIEVLDWSILTVIPRGQPGRSHGILSKKFLFAPPAVHVVGGGREPTGSPPLFQRGLWTIARARGASHVERPMLMMRPTRRKGALDTLSSCISHEPMAKLADTGTASILNYNLPQCTAY